MRLSHLQNILQILCKPDLLWIIPCLGRSERRILWRRRNKARLVADCSSNVHIYNECILKIDTTQQLWKPIQIIHEHFTSGILKSHNKNWSVGNEEQIYNRRGRWIHLWEVSSTVPRSGIAGVRLKQFEIVTTRPWASAASLRAVWEHHSPKAGTLIHRVRGKWVQYRTKIKHAMCTS